jgi:hypothetical protein
MQRDRSAIRNGVFIVGGACPVDVGPDAKRAGIDVGTFMTSTPTIITKSAAPSTTAAEIGARLDALQAKLASVVAQLRGGT